MRTFWSKGWLQAEKKTDPNFEGSIFQALGFSELLCPTCGAHLKDIGEENGEQFRYICLNACHLTNESRLRFGVLSYKTVKGGEDIGGKKEGAS